MSVRASRRVAVAEQTAGAFLLNARGLWLGKPHVSWLGGDEGLMLTAPGVRYWNAAGRARDRSWSTVHRVRFDGLETHELTPEQEKRALLFLPLEWLTGGLVEGPTALPVSATISFDRFGDQRMISSHPFWQATLSELEQVAVVDTFALFRKDPARAEVLADIAAVRASLHRLDGGEPAATAWRR